MFLDPKEIPDDARPYRILRTPAGRVGLSLTIASNELLFVREHYLDGRTSPCRYDQSCQGCERGHAPRLACYLWVLDEEWTLRILSLPHSGAVKVKLLTQICGTNVQGLEITVRRIGSTKRSAIQLLKGSYCTDKGRKVPQTPNLKATLCRIWGVSYLESQFASPSAN